MAEKSKGKSYCYEHPRPAVTVDIVLFHQSRGSIQALFIKRGREPFKGRWAFPGGFVDEDESLEQAAARELEEETGLCGVELHQIGAFGDPGRDPRGHTVSVVYSAVLEDLMEATAADDAEEVKWHNTLRPPKLAFDHKLILRVALERMLGESRAVKRSTSRKKI